MGLWGVLWGVAREQPLALLAHQDKHKTTANALLTQKDKHKAWLLVLNNFAKSTRCCTALTHKTCFVGLTAYEAHCENGPTQARTADLTVIGRTL